MIHTISIKVEQVFHVEVDAEDHEHAAHEAKAEVRAKYPGFDVRVIGGSRG